MLVETDEEEEDKGEEEKREGTKTKHQWFQVLFCFLLSSNGDFNSGGSVDCEGEVGDGEGGQKQVHLLNTGLNFDRGQGGGGGEGGWGDAEVELEG